MGQLPYVTPVQGQIARDLIDEALRTMGIIRTNSVMEFSHPEAILQAVRADTVVSFVFQSALRDDLGQRGLRIIGTPGLEIGIPLFLIHNRNKMFSQLQFRLINHIKQAFRDRIADVPKKPQT